MSYLNEYSKTFDDILLREWFNCDTPDAWTRMAFALHLAAHSQLHGSVEAFDALTFYRDIAYRNGEH